MDDGEECAETLLDRPVVRVPIIAAYIGVFLICLIGNLFTIVVICAHRSMRTATNFFLANLAVADLLVAIFCILQNMLHLVGALGGHWPLGETLCKLYAFVLHLVPCTGIGILVCVSVEKYIAVLHPLLALKLLTPRFRSLMMAAIWAISLLCNLPFYTTTKLNAYKKYAACSRGHDLGRIISTRNMITFSFVIWYCIPLCTIAFLYTRIGLVLWHSAPLKKLTQPALTSISGIEGSGPANDGTGNDGGGQMPMQKRSLAGYRMSASAASPNGTANGVTNGGLRGSKRSNSQPAAAEEANGGTTMAGGKELLPLIRVNRMAAERRASSESGEEDEEEDETEEEGEMMRGNRRVGNGTVGPLAIGEQQNGVDQKNSLPSSSANVVVSTVESRKKIIRLLIAIVCSFAILTLPHHARLLHSVWSKQQQGLCGPEALIQPVAYLLLFISSSCNPFLYAFMSQRFRSAIRDFFKCKRGRVRRKSTRTRTQNSDIVGCSMAAPGEGATGLSRCSSLTRLNHQNGEGGELATATSERNLLMANQQKKPMKETAAINGANNHLKVNSAALLGGKSDRSGSGGSASTASSVIHLTQRSNGSLQMAVVYRKCP